MFVGTVSGTSISFGTSVKVAEHTTSEQYSVPMIAIKKRVVAYHDDDDSSKGKGVVVSVNENTTLTPENYALVFLTALILTVLQQLFRLVVS